MGVTKKKNWHRRLYALSFTMFDLAPDGNQDRWIYWMTVLGIGAYCGMAVIIFASLNMCTLPFGVFAEPVWRPRARFRLLRFPNGIPIIPFSVAIALGYASYCTWLSRGILVAFGAWLLAGALGLFLIGLSIMYNKLRGAAVRSMPMDRREQ